MYSNFITPPDFVEDDFHTVTVIDATIEEVEILGRMCQGVDDQFNIYLYRNEMQNPEWLDLAAERSHAIIINTTISNPLYDKYLGLDKTYYYGPNNFVSPAVRLDTVFQYFAIRYSQQNK